MAHLINHLLVEVNCSDEEQALNMRHNFSQTFQQRMEEVMEKICSKYVNEEENLQIDKLEIDLGKHSSITFDSEFSAIFYQKFEQQLLAKLAVIPAAQRINSKMDAHLELLEYFLQKGALPWWANEATTNLDEISTNLFANNKTAIKDFLWKNRYNTAVWQRVAFQLNEQAQQVIIVLFEKLSYATTLFNELLQQIKKELGDSTTVETAGNAIAKLERIAENPVKTITGNAPLIFNTEKKTSSIRIALAQFVVGYFESEQNEYAKVTTAINKVVDGIKLPPAEQPLTIVNGLKGFGSLITEGDSNERERNEAANIPEKLTVKQAGIVLLTPFFKPFFTALQLLDGNEWKNKQAQYKAVHLLSYLGNGKQKPFEYQLLLEKLICGISLEAPVPADINLANDELQEAENLLQSVIEHWKALKNTSVNGLRESFLKREGIVTATANGWLLQLERKTMDVLLDSIPWGYSTIRLPWNNYVITTAW